MLQVPTVTVKENRTVDDTRISYVMASDPSAQSDQTMNEEGAVSLSCVFFLKPVLVHDQSTPILARAGGQTAKKQPWNFLVWCWPQCKVLRKQLTEPNATMPMPQHLHCLLGGLRRRFVCVVGIVRGRSCLLLPSIPSAGFEPRWQNKSGACGRKASKSNRQTARNEKVSTTLIFGSACKTMYASGSRVSREVTEIEKAGEPAKLKSPRHR